MKKLLISLLTIGVVGGTAFAASQAFFSDTEISSGNTFTAGELDLKIDNTSYYNGQTNPGSTWNLDDLTGHLFFNFTDLKPDDEGEDTISLHVQNDAYVCMNITKTADDDLTCTTPELVNDPTCTEPGIGQGELGGLLNFIFWHDDGDNVLESGETIFKEGTAAGLFDGAVWTVADSATGPILANDIYHIGKAWCFGTLTINPAADRGVDCDGTTLNNASQTDKFMADIEFTAVQARNNDNFLCNPQEDRLLWIIGDEETAQLDSPVDELNWPGGFGVFPTPPAIGADYTRTITTPVDDTADLEFPWNTNYNSNYARNINIGFSWSGATIPVRLFVGWGPGRSAQEQKNIFLDSNPLGTTPNRLGVPTAGWWEEMERFVDTYDFDLTSGNHTIRIEHLFGDGTVWDFIKLEKR